MSMGGASGRGGERFRIDAFTRHTGRPREFQDGYSYTTPTHDGEPTQAGTREDALTVLQRLAVGVDAERLLERVASREDAEALRAALLEVGARALVAKMEAGAGLRPRPGSAPAAVPSPAPASFETR